MARYGRGLPPQRLIRPQLIYPTYPVGKYSEESGRFDDQESHVIPLTAWRYRRLITVDHTKIDANLTDYPVAVTLTASNFDFGKALPNGQDIVFVSNNGSSTVLQFERERYSDSLKMGNFWVRLPTVLTASDTTFWMYYGNDNSVDYQNPTDVWDQYYTGVYHMDEDGGVSTNTFMDSTSVNLAGGVSTGLSGSSRQEAIHAQGQIFNGSSSYINIGRLNTVRSATQYTVSAWVTITATGAQRVIVEEARGQGDATTRFKFAIDGSQHFNLFGVDVDTNTYRTLATNASVTATADGAWFFVTAVYDSTNDTNFVTVNGTKATTTDTGNLPVSNTVPMGDTTIGRRTDFASEFWSGKLDEVRISGTARSDAWIKADYNGGLGTLLSVGSEIGADQAITDNDRGQFQDIVTPTVAYAIPLLLSRQTLNPPITPINVSLTDTGTSVEAATVNVLASDTGTSAESGSVNTGNVPISSSDTGTGTEGTPTIGVTGADTGTSAETTSIAATLPSADTGSGTEGTPGSIALSTADTGTSTETTSIAATRSGADTGVGTEGTPSIGVTGTDTGTDAETTSIAATLSSSDTGSGAETAFVGQTGTDTGSWVEATSIAVTTSSSDTGTGTEGTPLIGQTSADTRPAVTETTSIAVTTSSTDTGSGTETTAIAATLSTTDTGSGTEQTPTIAFSTTDTSTGTEGTPVVGASSADTGTSVEATDLQSARFTENLESGTNGSVITTSNTLFSAVLGTAAVFDSAIKVEGTLSAKFPGGSAQNVQENFLITNQRYFRRYFYMTGAPSVATIADNVRSGSTVRAQVRVNIDSTVSLRNNVTAVATSTGTIPSNAWSRYEWFVDNTGTTQTLRVFVGTNLHGTTPDFTISGTYNQGTFDNVTTGQITSATWVTYVDAFASDPSNWIGPISGTTPISDSDTGTGVEGTPTIGISSTDTGTGAEGTPSVSVTSADTGTDVEVGKIGVTGTDTSTSTETTSIAATFTTTDTGTGTESTPTIGVTSPDTGSSTDTGIQAILANDTGTGTEGLGAIALSSADTGSGVDTGSVTGTGASPSGADTGTSTEATSIAATLSTADTSTTTETALITPPAGADTGTGAEATSIAATLSSSDIGSSAEVGLVSVTSADTSTSVESGNTTATLSSSETGTGVEGLAKIGVTGSDTWTDSEAGAAGVSIVGSDTGSSVESFGTFGIIAAVSDTGTGVEGTPTVAFSTSDTGSGTEGIGVIAVSSSDTGSATEAVNTLNVLANDLRTSVEASTIAASLSTSDTGSSTDSGSSTATFSSADTGTGSEGLAKIGVTSNDLRTSVESGTTTATVSANDFASAVEALSSLLANLSSNDSGAGVETWIVDTGHHFIWTFRLDNGSWQFDHVVVNWRFDQTFTGDIVFPNAKVAWALAGTKAADA